ncbi:MAG: hypothetical protein ACE5FL_06560 [Myxococcota bacterium]
MDRDVSTARLARLCGLPLLAALACASPAPPMTAAAEPADIAEAGLEAAAHARLMRLTGDAPRGATPSGTASLRLAEEHPYDPWALLVAGREMVRSGADAAAADSLRRAVWLGDRDPASAAEAAALLARISDSWQGHLLVPVHLYADESIRAVEGWEFRLRTLLLRASNGLAPLLRIRFTPASIRSFDSRGASADLASIHERFTRATESPPSEGILAAFTRRLPRARKAPPQRGLAEFLGRRLTVRLAPGASTTRVLIHEILHLYGAMHVADRRDSLMNPAGDSLYLDSASHRTAFAMRARSFAGQGIEADVLPNVDLPEVLDAYRAVLAAHPTLRRMDAAETREGVLSDPHLADVARVVAVLMLSDGRRGEALELFDAAARLYPAGSARARETAGHARSLRRAMRDGRGS